MFQNAKTNQTDPQAGDFVRVKNLRTKRLRTLKVEARMGDKLYLERGVVAYVSDLDPAA